MSAPVRDDLKSTLNLPKTDFAMKANLPVNEPKMLARWDEMRLTTRSARPAPVALSMSCTMGRHTPMVSSISAPPSINA